MKKFIISKLKELENPSSLLTRVCQDYKIAPESPECDTLFSPDGSFFIDLKTGVNISVNTDNRCSVFQDCEGGDIRIFYKEELTFNQFCDLVVLCSLL